MPNYDDLDSKLLSIRKTLGSKQEQPNHAPQKHIEPVEDNGEAQKLGKKIIKLLSVNTISLVEVTKRKEGGYRVRSAALVNKWFLCSLMMNALLLSILITKAAGLW